MKTTHFVFHLVENILRYGFLVLISYLFLCKNDIQTAIPLYMGGYLIYSIWTIKFHLRKKTIRY